MLNNWTKYIDISTNKKKRDLSSNNDKPTTLKARMKKIYNIFAAGWFRPDVVVPGSPTLPVFFSPVWRLFDAHLSVLRGAALGEDQLQFWEFSSPSIHLDSATKISRSCLAGSFFRGSSSRLPAPSLTTDQIRTLAFTKWYYIFVIGCHSCTQFLGICDYFCVEDTNMKLRSSTFYFPSKVRDKSPRSPKEILHINYYFPLRPLCDGGTA